VFIYAVDGRRGHGGRIYHISSRAGGQYINVVGQKLSVPKINSRIGKALR